MENLSIEQEWKKYWDPFVSQVLKNLENLGDLGLDQEEQEFLQRELQIGSKRFFPLLHKAGKQIRVQIFSGPLLVKKEIWKTSEDFLSFLNFLGLSHSGKGRDPQEDACLGWVMYEVRKSIPNGRVHLSLEDKESLIPRF